MHKTIRAVALGVSMLLQAHLSGGYEVVLEDLDGSSYAFHVDSKIVFADLLSEIQSSFHAIEQHKEDLLGVRGGEAIHLSVSNSGTLVTASKKTDHAFRNYDAPLTSEEKSDIQFIVKTLGNASLPKITTNESALTKAGSRIKKVHPLQFLTCVFTDEELKVAMRNLEGRTWVWTRFIDGLVESLGDEHKTNNLMQFIPDFASKLQIDQALILPHLQEKRWKDFVVLLIHKIPRSGDTKRYNM
jgi:hypothetical protein